MAYVLIVSIITANYNPITLIFPNEESCEKARIEFANKQFEINVQRGWTTVEHYKNVSFCVKVSNVK